jgi:hypothetical protein
MAPKKKMRADTPAALPAEEAAPREERPALFSMVTVDRWAREVQGLNAALVSAFASCERARPVSRGLTREGWMQEFNAWCAIRRG